MGSEPDSTREAVGGGTMSDSTPTQITSLDATVNNSTATLQHLMYGYSLLLKGGMNTSNTRPGIDTIAGDAIEKWEITPDLLQITLKVRPNHKFDPRPPTSGRAMTSADIKWSWDKYVKTGQSAGDFSHQRSETGPIESVTTPDASTIVMRQAFPFALIPELMASYQHFYIEPRDDSFDFRTGMRGSGPFFLEDYRPSLDFTWTRNPDWYEKGQPFLDKIVRYIVPDYAAGLAQFQAQKLWTYPVLANDVLPTKQRFPSMVLLQDPGLGFAAHLISFSNRDDSVFKDVRLRRALSMALERNVLVDTLFELQAFTQAGIPVDKFWNSHINCAHAGWIDPKGSGLGEGAKYFQQNTAEAKKLIEAAGLKAPVASTYGYFTEPTKDGKENLIIQTMINDSGLFNMKSDILDYASSWRTASESGGKGYGGVLYNRSATTSADQNLAQLYTPTGRSSIWDKPVPGVTELIAKERMEPDPRRREELVKQAQQQLALEWPAILFPGQARPFTLRWPWLRNFGVFNESNPSAKQVARWWYDASKKAA
jgi:ABC-type transport system substrate-binding protein